MRDQNTILRTILFGLACFALASAPNAFGVVPPPDGSYPGGNTAEGDNALLNVNTAIGINNTAVGANALRDDTTGYYNAAVGSGALASNRTGNFNMAIGTEALTNNNANLKVAIGFRVGYMNTIGHHLTGIGAGALRNNTHGTHNTAVGADALREVTTSSANTAVGSAALQMGGAGSNTAIGADALSETTTGFSNTATGYRALHSNTEGYYNTVIGRDAMLSNTLGAFNAALGVSALGSNTTGTFNTAVGESALAGNTGGGSNTAMGNSALASNATSDKNTGIGYFALFNATGNSNTALGYQAGWNQTSGSNNVYIGAGLLGVAGESNACYIASIFGQTSGSGAPVLINAAGKLGTATSSERFKEDIKPIDNASEELFALTPVTFRYKKEIDSQGIPQFGLVAEDVAKVNPALVLPDKDGKPYTVRYDQVNAMLLNEFLKEHKTVQELKSNAAKQEATIARQQKQIEALAAGLQKVSAEMERSKAMPNVVFNNP